MGKLVVTCFITLDAVVEDPQNWSLDFQSEDTGVHNSRILEEADAMLLGRTTYEGFAAAWPERSGDPYSDRFNAMPKHVATRTLSAPLSWNNSHVVEGELVAAARELKATQDVLVWGSPSVADQLAAAGLVDAYELLCSPVVRGTGKRLWQDVPGPLGLRFDAAATLSGGMHAVRLVPAA